jgi:two-component system sensor histidine kinase GlrK
MDLSMKEKTYTRYLMNLLVCLKNYRISIPGYIFYTSLAALLLVALITAFAVMQVTQLKNSIDSLFNVGMMVMEVTNELETDHKNTVFLVHKSLTFNDVSYIQRLPEKIAQQRNKLATLTELLKNEVEAHNALIILNQYCEIYWQWLEQVTLPTPVEESYPFEAKINNQLIQVQRLTSQLAQQQTSVAHKGSQRIIIVLLSFVVGTALIGILICLLYTIKTAMPLRAVSQALLRIGTGDFSEPVKLKGDTELVELSDAINRMQNRLLSLENSKIEFLSLVSHEIKTPLTSFRSGIEILRSGSLGTLPKVQQRIVEIMYKHSIHLGISIQDMLGLYALQSTKLAIDMHPCNINDVITDAIDQISPLMHDKKQRIVWQPTQQRMIGNIDPIRTCQVITNLLSNAHKYGPEDSAITLTAKINQHYIEITVSDEGPGIPPQYLSKALERFCCIPVNTDKQPGTGLGLSIVKDLTEAQGGHVVLKNAVEGGLQVTVSLPITQFHADINTATNR